MGNPNIFVSCATCGRGWDHRNESGHGSKSDPAYATRLQAELKTGRRRLFVDPIACACGSTEVVYG